MHSGSGIGRKFCWNDITRTVSRYQKIAIALVSGAALFSLVLILVLVFILPDPATVGRALALKSHRKSDPQSDWKQNPSPSQSSVPPSSVSLTSKIKKTNASSVAGVETKSDTEDPAMRKQRIIAAFSDRYLVDDRIHSRVCENLATPSPPFKNAEEFGKQIERSLLGESRPSAAVEAIMLPVEYMFKNESVRELIKAAREASMNEKTGFMQKAQFYALTAQVTTSILSSRDELEKVSAKAYELFALSRAVALKPKILEDPDLGDLCSRFERAVIDGISQNEKDDRENMLRMFERHGISMAAIGYDPKAPTGLRLVQDGSSLQIKLPWLDRVFKN